MVYGVRFPTCGGFTLISPQPFACLGSQPFVLCLENLRTFEGLELLTFQLPQESFKKSVPISRFFWGETTHQWHFVATYQTWFHFLDLQHGSKEQTSVLVKHPNCSWRWKKTLAPKTPYSSQQPLVSWWNGEDFFLCNWTVGYGSHGPFKDDLPIYHDLSMKEWHFLSFAKLCWITKGLIINGHQCNPCTMRGKLPFQQPRHPTFLLLHLSLPLSSSLDDEIMVLKLWNILGLVFQSNEKIEKSPIVIPKYP